MDCVIFRYMGGTLINHVESLYKNDFDADITALELDIRLIKKFSRQNRCFRTGSGDLKISIYLNINRR